ncbi:MAG: glycoside hydrolase family 15 protein [Candidatus Micrarchaeota archaeon]|nr:glycoside hydrolase family 15 protein [Candidatus Micrarchaeota archaeon]
MTGESGRKRAFLSNGLVAAIEVDGSIDWFTAPRFDSQSIFARLLDERTGGHFSIRPEGGYRVSSSYVGKSLILKSVFSAEEGRLEVIDFLPIGIPSIVRIFNSEVPFIVEINPTFNYGMINPDVEYMGNGVSFRNAQSKESFDVSVSGEYTRIHDGMLKFRPGKGSIMGLYSKDYRYGLFSMKAFVYPSAEDALANSLHRWKGQMESVDRVKNFKSLYYRSLAVVIGLTYAPSGGIIAAPTTSLPAIQGKGNNWDYRYVWIRDAAYAAEALSKIGYLTWARRAISFMLNVIDPSSKSFDHPLFEIDGTAPPVEEAVGWLSGYRGSLPVRIGNAAYTHVQMDTEGAFVEALYNYFVMSKDLRYIKESMWAIDAIGKWCMNGWPRKSISLWEERTTPKHYVHTKLMNWMAIDRIGKLKLAVGDVGAAEHYRRTASKVKDDILKNGFSREIGSFVKYYGSDEVDSSLLTLPLYDFIDANDPRFTSTFDTIIERLMDRKGMLMRTEHDYEGENSHPFTLVNTWLARVYIKRGETRKAQAAIKNMEKYATDLMLFGERVNVKTREPLGNFPQLFPHAGLLAAISEYDKHVRSKG